MNKATILKGQYVKCRYFIGHPAFSGETNVTVRVTDNKVYYHNQEIKVSRKGWKSLKLDMQGVL